MSNQLVWFRSDLRITDNPALFCACETNQPIIAIFFICEKQWQSHDYGLAKVDFILRNLEALSQSLWSLGIPLLVRSVNDFASVAPSLCDLAATHNISKVWCNQEYELNEITRDKHCAEQLSALSVSFEAFHDQCIAEPNSVTTKDGNMYRVFTPFYRQWQKNMADNPVECLPAPSKLSNQASLSIASDTIPTLKHYPINAKQGLLASLKQNFSAGEQLATDILMTFAKSAMVDYKTQRDFPSVAGISKLSPYLSVGAISMRQCFVVASDIQARHPHAEGVSTWISELCWRDFYRHIMVNKPRLVQHHAFNEAVDTNIPWSYHQQNFQKWCEGKTGVPIIDAAMRCLNATGFMHNRLRMVVAMFLTKNLLIDWRWGERYFMQNLVDADFASNNGGWQWSASVGTDAAPYFRVMNPFSQAKKFDEDAVFIKQWLPALAKLEPRVIHDVDKLQKVVHACDYSPVMVDIKQSRADAIATFKANKP